ncbi:hypothetical protein TNIN_342201 [Trichonephila inaurata madagascariensis]|uniref:Uncharacterized protein n=1 Tax=Trichonephila inaurata madagascariensis TaxID=2747483 RepID=A0A8X7BXL2_9ARAC|nr:hypothetical protein TNIN_342201 [Trichonephila inaurata madagascariensis]
MAFFGEKQDLILLAKELGRRESDKRPIIDLKDLIIESKDYEQEFVKAQLSVILEERIRVVSPMLDTSMGTTPICDVDLPVKVMGMMPEVNVIKNELALTCAFRNGILLNPSAMLL